MSAGTTNRATVVIGDGASMAANIRASGPGALSMSFRLDTGNHDLPRLVGDMATVTTEDTESCVLVEIVSVAVMGFVEVCEASVKQQIYGPPIGGKHERRKSERYRLYEPVIVDLLSPALAENMVGELADVSAEGCGLKLDRHTYRKVGSLIALTLRFELPRGERQLVLKAKRRNTRALGRDIILMGMIWSREPGEEADFTLLAGYLDKRARH